MARGVTQIAITRFIKKMDRLEAFASDEAYNALEDIGQEATEYMKRIIIREGTDFSDRAAAQGLNRGPGRVRTGTMIDGVDYQETSTGFGEVGSRLSIEFGYFDAPPSRKYPDVSYVQMQEEGFRNVWRWFDPLNATYSNGRPKNLVRRIYPYRTEGTFAFRDAKDYIRNYYRPVVASAASKAIARRMRGV